MTDLKVTNWFEMRNGPHKGRCIVSCLITPEENALSQEDLNKLYMDKKVSAKEKEYIVKGIENVRFFVPDCPPELGLLLEEIK